MSSRLVAKFVAVKALGIVVAMGIVWISIDFFAFDYFASLLDKYHVPQKQEVLGK